MALLCLWIPWSCGVPGLHVRSPVSGRVCVLPQSAIVTLLSLLWVGLLLAFVRGPCLRLTLWASTCVGPGGCPAFSRVGPAPSTWVPLLWTWLVGGGFHRVPSPLSSFGMSPPFGVNSVFCHYGSRTKVSIGGGFFCDVASHLGVVLSFSYVLCWFVVAPSGW